jgi:16S rRNA (guanine966-N2)-methyltransferase
MVKKNSVRINAGVWRNRLLQFPGINGLRPSPERVRQTVFNWLGQDMTSRCCLDIFAGTGVFGFEALSRNAKSVVLVFKTSRQISESKSSLTRSRKLSNFKYGCNAIFSE